VALERVAELAAVERVHHVEELRDAARLVALDPADEVPARRRGAGFGELLGDVATPVGGLLEVVLADVAEPRAHRRDHARGGRALGDAEQRHAVGAATRARRGALHALAQRGERGAGVHACAARAQAISASVSSIGSPITLLSLPSTRITNIPPSPW
jgi:hypothetical protein